MNVNTVTDNHSPGYCEYLVPGFTGKRMIAVRIFAVLFGIILTCAMFSILFIMPQVVFVWLVLILLLEIMAFRLTNREFEYIVSMGEMSVDIIYGKRIRRKYVTFRIADADSIFPVNGFDDAALRCLNADKIIYAARKKDKYLYCIYMKDSSGKNSKTAVIFSSCAHLNNAIKFYNRSCFKERK